jgi:hypothetical protein
VLALASLGFGFGAWELYRDKAPLFKIDLVFDETAHLDPVLLTSFLTRVQQPHLRITLLDRQLTSRDAGQFLVFDKALREANPLLRASTDATHTILVTNKMLANAEWSNLFYSARGNFGVVSMRGVADPTKPNEQVLALRYLASMVPLAAMHALANERSISLLPDRSSATEHGCLHDFSVNRLLLIEKLRRGPELCAAEVVAISAAFGRVLVAEYQQILLSSSRENAP